MADLIHIEQLELSAYVGVTAGERATAQRLTVTLTLEPTEGFRGLDDALEKTVDYFAVCQAVKALTGLHPRKLIETLAEEIAELVLARFTVRAVEVEVRKYILRDTAHVAVRLRREG